MSSSPLTRTFAPDAGPRVQLRLARRGDIPAVTALLAGHGVKAAGLDVARLLSYDPAHRAVLAAFAPIEGTETLVGLGAIDLDPGADPDTLVVDERLTDGLGELIGLMLRERAARHHRRVA